MNELPVFRITPTLRCMALEDPGRGTVCGKRAEYTRPGIGVVAMHYFCTDHRTALDVLIPASAIILRIRLSATIDIAGVTLHRPAAHQEAVERLRQAVEAVGGRLDVLDVTSTIGRLAPDTAASVHRSGSGDTK